MKRIALTFDDGSLDFYETVFPLLKNANVPATLFVVGGYLDGAALPSFPCCSGDQIYEMAASGLVEIGAHGYEHKHEESFAGFEKCRNTIMGLCSGLIPHYQRIGCATPYEAYPSQSLHKAISTSGLFDYIRVGKCYSRRPMAGFYRLLFSKTRNPLWESKALSCFANPIRSLTKRRVPIVFSIQVHNNMSVPFLIDIIERARNNSLVVLQFHTVYVSTVADNDRFAYGAWEQAKLIDLINTISQHPDVAFGRLDQLIK